MGDIVTSRLVENFSELMDYGFTASMEEKLDDIAEGDINWTQVLDEFYQDFQEKLEIAGGDNGMRPNNAVTTEDIACPRSEEHTSELQSRPHLVCRLLLEKKKQQIIK